MGRRRSWIFLLVRTRYRTEISIYLCRISKAALLFLRRPNERLESSVGLERNTSSSFLTGIGNRSSSYITAIKPSKTNALRNYCFTGEFFATVEWKMFFVSLTVQLSIYLSRFLVRAVDRRKILNNKKTLSFCERVPTGMTRLELASFGCGQTDALTELRYIPSYLAEEGLEPPTE